jgi:hypothetical protein
MATDFTTVWYMSMDYRERHKNPQEQSIISSGENPRYPIFSTEFVARIKPTDLDGNVEPHCMYRNFQVMTIELLLLVVVVIRDLHWPRIEV